VSYNFQREYEVHLLLGSPSATRLWQRDAWAEVFTILEGLARSPRGVPVTSSMQFESSNREPVKFGRIGWNLEGHSKWTHASETTHRFLSAEVWTPSRGACTKDGCPPDFLFVLWNQEFFSKDSTFRDVVLLAVPITDPRRVKACSEAARRLAAMTQARFHGRMVRPWARPFGKTMFTDCLGDMPTTGLFRLGQVRRGTPGNDILLERWEPLSS
jgi:hypothetical protein